MFRRWVNHLPDWHRKAIATLGHGLDRLGSVFSIRQNSPQVGDVLGQGYIFNKDAGPKPDEVFLSRSAALRSRAGSGCFEDLGRQGNRLSVMQQQCSEGSARKSSNSYICFIARLFDVTSRREGFYREITRIPSDYLPAGKQGC